MDILIKGAPKGGTVKAIPSKSAAHRILIAAALSGLDLTPYCDGLSQDITATKTCLQRMTGAGKTEGTGTAGTVATGAETAGTLAAGIGTAGTLAAGEGTAGTVAASAGTAGTVAAGTGTAGTEAPAPLQLPCGESGSTLRFLIPLAGVLGIDAEFLCEGRLPDRPMEPFLEVLAAHGCRVTGRNPKELRGTLGSGNFRLPGNISSQYVTGLLMALPLAAGDSRITVEGVLQSRPYIDLTLEVLAKAGITIRESAVSDGGVSNGAGVTDASFSGTVFHVPGGQQYQLPETELAQIEGDWSNAAFWLVMDAMLRGLAPDTAGQIAKGAPAGHAEEMKPAMKAPHAADTPIIHVDGLDPDSAQGDRAIVQVIEQIRSADSLLLRSEYQKSGAASRIAAGAASTQASSGASRLDISVAGRSGFVELDVSDIPDLVPIIAALACSRPAGALTHITGAQRLRFKESDRLRAVTETLTALGGDITEEPAGLMIRGTGTLTGGEADSFGDHRIVMMAAAAACIAKDDILIRGAEAVNKSYPGFFDDYRMLGGTAEPCEL